MPSFVPARITTTNTSLNEDERMMKWGNKRANQITNTAYAYEDAEMFADHLESEVYNICYDLEIANNSNAYLEGTMRTMQQELAELREFKETTMNTLSRCPDLAGVFNYQQKEMKRTENAAKKAAVKKKKSPKCLRAAHQRRGSRRACSKGSKYKGFYAGM